MKYTISVLFVFQIFILMSFLLATRTVGVTVNTIGPEGWQPSNRNIRPAQQVLSSGIISVMRPPPPSQEPRPRIHPRHPNHSVTSHSTHLVNQRPAVLPHVSFAQFPSYQDDVRKIRSNFAQFPQGSFSQNNSPENVRQQFVFNQKVVDSSSRKPQQFTDPSENFLSEYVVNKHLAHFPGRQQLQFASPALQHGYTQKLIGSNTEHSLMLNHSRFAQNTIPPRITRNQNEKDHANRLHTEENVGNLLQAASSQSTQFSVPQTSPSTERKYIRGNLSSDSQYRSLEADVQFTQSIEASEHHSTYHAPDSVLLSVQPFSAIRITKPPVLGSGIKSFSENQLKTTATSDIRKKVTLKDILDEDCPKAKEMGYCASPPRYPS